MADVTAEELDSCVEIVSAMWGSEVAGGGYEREAKHAAAMRMSGSGIIHAAPALGDLVEWAIEIGYMAALKDVQDGEHDNNIRQWRPDLAEDWDL